MKIAILVAGLPPVYNGGTEIATVEIAKYAVKAGHEVHVIALDGTNKKFYRKRSDFIKYYVGDGYKIHRVRTISISYLYGLVALPSVVFKVLKIKPDVIHAQGFQMGISAFVASIVSSFL